MRSALLAPAFLAFLAFCGTPALARGFGFAAGVVDPAPAQGENIELAVTVQNWLPRERRAKLYIRVRGHRLTDQAARRFRTKPQRVRLTVPGDGEFDARLAVFLPPEAAGAVSVEVRLGRTRRFVDAYIVGDHPVPGDPTAADVPFQPVLTVRRVYEFDGDHDARTQVIRDRAAWEQLLDDVRVRTPSAWGRESSFRDVGEYARPFDVDFENETVLAIFAGNRAHEDFLRVLNVRADEAGVLTCSYRVVRYRPPFYYTADHAWRPYLFVTIPRTDAEVRFRRRPAAQRDPRARDPR